MKNFWSSRLSEVLAIVFILPIVSYGQFSRPEEKFPREERYLYPINPGQPGSLAGTMGELRQTHFHSGIDIRTNNKIGYAVLASKSGYISRISVSPGGYGNVLYISHPDGNTTLYAHLDRFRGKVAEYVLQEQYRQKSSSVDLYFRPDQFLVRQGDTVALSGNSGSSGGPHLHFDIRDPDNYALNPLLVEGFPEIVDNQPPAVEKIALKTLDINSRINDKFGRFEFYVQRNGNEFTFPTPILATGNIGIEVLAKDKLAPKSAFYGGVNYIEMSVDGKPVFNQSIDKINIAETRGIYTLMDFRTMRLSGSRFYKLYIDDGNDLSFYDKSPSRGQIKVGTSGDASVKVSLKDSHGNVSNLTLKLRGSAPSKVVPTLESLKSPIEYDIVDNTIVVSVPPCDTASAAILYNGSKTRLLEADYSNASRAVYLIDLRKGLPDSLLICGNRVVTNLRTIIPPGQEYNYYSDAIDVNFPDKAVYDTVYLTTYHGLDSNGNEIFNIGSRTVPLNKSISVTIRPEQRINWDKSHAVYRVAGRGYSHVGGRWQNGGVHFTSREFGDFVVLRDTIAPNIRAVAVNGYTAKFKIRDDLSGIDKIEATLNGEWLLMHYDPKTATIWSEQLNKKNAMKGKLVVTVTDNAGNESVYSNEIVPHATKTR